MINGIIVQNNPVNLIDPWGLSEKGFAGKTWEFAKNFFKGIADAMFFPPPSLADPEAMCGVRKLIDRRQEQYDDWGELYNVWGDGNPYHNPFTITHEDRKSGDP